MGEEEHYWKQPAAQTHLLSLERKLSNCHQAEAAEEQREQHLLVASFAVVAAVDGGWLFLRWFPRQGSWVVCLLLASFGGQSSS